MNEKEIKEYERRYEMIMNQIKQNKERTPSRNDLIEIENEYDMIDDLFQSNQRLLNMTTTANTNERIQKLKEQQHELTTINNQLVEEMIAMNKQTLKSIDLPKYKKKKEELLKLIIGISDYLNKRNEKRLGKIFGKCFSEEGLLKPPRLNGNTGGRDYDVLLKYRLVGEYGVGKTTLMLTYTDGHPTEYDNYETIGVDFKVKTIQSRDKRVRLLIVCFLFHFFTLKHIE